VERWEEKWKGRRNLKAETGEPASQTERIPRAPVFTFPFRSPVSALRFPLLSPELLLVAVEGGGLGKLFDNFGGEILVGHTQVAQG
jgi:hypothetical protein